MDLPDPEPELFDAWQDTDGDEPEVDQSQSGAPSPGGVEYGGGGETEVILEGVTPDEIDDDVRDELKIRIKNLLLMAGCSLEGVQIESRS